MQFGQKSREENAFLALFFSHVLENVGKDMDASGQDRFSLR